MQVGRKFSCEVGVSRRISRWNTTTSRIFDIPILQKELLQSFQWGKSIELRYHARQESSVRGFSRVGDETIVRKVTRRKLVQRVLEGEGEEGERNSGRLRASSISSLSCTTSEMVFVGCSSSVLRCAFVLKGSFEVKGCACADRMLPRNGEVSQASQITHRQR